MRDAREPIPGRYSGAIAVMQEMHWSWSDLNEAPADLVEEILHRQERIGYWTRERQRLETTKSENRRRSKHG
jgi:hypothetical protein